MTAGNEATEVEFVLPKSAYADYITSGLAGRVNENARSNSGMYPLEDATTDNDAVAENTSAPVSLAAQPASAPLYQVTVGSKTVSFNTTLLKNAAFADYAPGLAGNANEEDGEDN